MDRAQKLIDFGPGPWLDEPDRAEWRHVGLPCLALRAPLGHWCGYAAVPPGHPLHGRGYDHEVAAGAPLELAISCHGGLTYSDRCAGNICHVARPGEPDDVWWFGFDCAHSGDFVPRSVYLLRQHGLRSAELMADRDVYRELAYVRAATERLAEQLAGWPREEVGAP